MNTKGILMLTLSGLAVGLVAAGPAQARVSNTDRSFAKTAAQAGKGEVIAAKIALERGIDANVREFAERMVRDHTAANHKLLDIADLQGIALPSNLDPGDQAQIDKLRSLSGPEFDQAYSRFQVIDHRKAIALFKNEATNGADPGLRQFASSTLPTLEMHQRMSYQVVASLVPTPSLMAHRHSPR